MTSDTVSEAGKSWLDRNGMALVGLVVSLLLYVIGSMFHQEPAQQVALAGLGTSVGLKLDGVWSRTNILAK